MKTALYRLMDLLTTRAYVRRCRDCLDESVHSHHLTWLGRWRFGKAGR